MFKAGERDAKALLEDAIPSDPRRDLKSVNSVVGTLRISLDYIKTQDKEAINLLSHMSILDSSAVPKSVLISNRSSPRTLRSLSNLPSLHGRSVIDLVFWSIIKGS